MNGEEIRSIFTEAQAIASEAAALVLSGFRRIGEVHRKGPIDLVTEFDLASEALIRERLGARFPGHAIVGEEGDHSARAELVWYVDPLDGTTNFAHGHPFFSVSIALCRRGDPLVGVVVAPAIGVTWAAARGLGASRNGGACRVSPRTVLDDALVATGFPYDRGATDDNVRETAAFLARTRGIRRCGSAAIDLAMVADGTYDVYWEKKLNPWDLAAGALLVTEAGGRLSDYDGTPADVTAGRIVASNAHLHEVALAVIREARRGLPDPAETPA